MESLTQSQHIEVVVGLEKYAFKIEDVVEIIKYQTLTVLPESDRYIKGVMNLRGSIVPVISLHLQFGTQEEEYSKLTRIIVVNYQEEKLGVLVDRVNKVTRFTEIQPPPDKAESLYLDGIGTTEDGLVGLLKLDEIFKQSTASPSLDQKYM